MATSDVGTYTYGPSGGTGPHQVKSIAGAFNSTISYDADGNMLSDTGDGRTMSWTSFNQPATITQGGVTTTFSYDPEHRRIAMSSTTPVVTLYNWDEATGTYSTVVETAADYDDYLFAEGGVVGVQQTNVVNHLISTVYYHNDGLGSVIGLSNDAGAMVEKDGYDAWGKRRFATGADDAGDTLANSSETTRGFTQQEEVPQAGLVNLNARLYDPHLGRFLSADPIGHAGGPNLYAYGNNNPMRFTDPSGLAPTVSPARAAQIAAITAGNGPPGSPQFLDAHANFRSTIATISDGLQGNDVTFSSEGLLSGEISALQTGFSATSFAGSIDTFSLAPGVPFGGGQGGGGGGGQGAPTQASDLNSTSTTAAAAAQPTAGIGSPNNSPALLGNSNGPLDNITQRTDAELDQHATGDKSGLPPAVADAVEILGFLVSATGDQSLINTFNNSTIIYSNVLNPGVVAYADYTRQTIVVFSGILDQRYAYQDEDGIDVDMGMVTLANAFVLAHEFGHLQPGNYTLQSQCGLCLSGNSPAEQNANAFSRGLLGIQTNPPPFQHYGGD